MDIYVCLGKETKQGKTYYMLKNIINSSEQIVDGDELKKYMRIKQVDVTNLTLTSDNRLVQASSDKADKINKLINTVMQAPNSIKDKVQPLDASINEKVEKFASVIITLGLINELGHKSIKKYMNITKIDEEDRNIIRIETRVGATAYVDFEYQTICYGTIKDNGSDMVCFDIKIKADKVMDHKNSVVKCDADGNVEHGQNKCALGRTGSILASQLVPNNVVADCIAIPIEQMLDALEPKGSTKYKGNFDVSIISDIVKTLGRGILTYLVNDLMELAKTETYSSLFLCDYITYDKANDIYGCKIAVSPYNYKKCRYKVPFGIITFVLRAILYDSNIFKNGKLFELAKQADLQNNVLVYNKNDKSKTLVELWSKGEMIPWYRGGDFPDLNNPIIIDENIVLTRKRLIDFNVKPDELERYKQKKEARQQLVKKTIDEKPIKEKQKSWRNIFKL